MEAFLTSWTADEVFLSRASCAVRGEFISEEPSSASLRCDRNHAPEYPDTAGRSLDGI
jgi:hypothetical protein